MIVCIQVRGCMQTFVYHTNYTADLECQTYEFSQYIMY